MPTEYSGWILDVYADRGKGVVVWFVCKDGRRLRFVQDQAVTFYADGDWQELARMTAFLKGQPCEVSSAKRKHLFRGEIKLVSIRVPNGALQRSLFRKLHEMFPELEFYDADLALPIHYFVHNGIFPLAHCTIAVDENKKILSIELRDDKWELNPELPTLRTMDLVPSDHPVKGLPDSIRVTFNNQTVTVKTESPAYLLRRLDRIIERCDPDIVLSQHGDSWLFPYLFSIAKKHKIEFNPNRDKTRQPLRVEANQFESYGHLVHRDQQTLLFGRLHIDPKNSMAFKDWGYEGYFETARLSNLPVQNAARRSAGGAFVGMQVTASLEKGILIPIRKEQREKFKNANQMIAADNGGVIFKPITGLHFNVAEIDFFSMYPHIMTGWNISAETVGRVGRNNRMVPGIDAIIDQDESGIVADILKPILAKRAAAKDILESGNTEGYHLPYLKTAYEFLKGLGWVSYGYQGFSGNRIGSIEAHEAINAVSRDVILHAKEAAEDWGFEVLHVYVDSLFISLGNKVDRLASLPAEIRKRTGLKADIEGTLKWIAFLPSKQNERVPVPNCFFGVFESGEIKTRGIMERRGDTPKYIADVQRKAIELMATKDNVSGLRNLIPELVDYFKTHFDRLIHRELPWSELVISQTLSRDIQDFTVISPAGNAAKQVLDTGKELRAGQNVDFVRVKGKPNSLSTKLMSDARLGELDVNWYAEQLVRAADEVLSPLGVPYESLRAWFFGEGVYWSPTDYVYETPFRLPLLQAIAVRSVTKSGYLPPLGNQ
jgi:DNA polymerase-2